MNHSASPVTVDHDDIIRARTALLASGRRTPREEVRAYRVLAQVSPAAYLPLLAGSLLSRSYQIPNDRPDVCLPLVEEAVAAARAIDPAEPARAEVLRRALHAYQRELYAAGRRAEGLAVRAELGPGIWATGLLEEGRYAEAADALTRVVPALRADGPRSGALAWSLLEWTTALDAAGRHAEALAAFADFVAMQAEEAANERASLSSHLLLLLRYTRMLDAAERREDAAAVRREALALLTELAATGEPRNWSGYQAVFWAVLLSISGAESERFAPGEPRPPFGATVMDWSPDIRKRYFDACDGLREQVDALAPLAADDPGRHLAELVRLQRVLTVRSAVRSEACGCLSAERAGPLFDEGVELARRLAAHAPADGTAALVTALTDRCAFHIAGRDFAAALADFREALTLQTAGCGTIRPRSSRVLSSQ
ncbi:hypothetical protein ACIRNI_15040 [Streptomyces sp. NPDC093546]|uniref:hypothetical protein n=1 Tax=Streptomyces sp. NPDC093546 TaxID=3366040 RepID=UPI00380DC9D7